MSGEEGGLIIYRPRTRGYKLEKPNQAVGLVILYKNKNNLSGVGPGILKAGAVVAHTEEE